VTGATTEGTAGASDPDGLQKSGFEVVETIDPAKINPDTGLAQGPGVVSAVVLSFRLPITLAPRGTATVLCMDVEAGSPQGDGPISGQIVWVDGLTGSGQPVANAATVEGATREFCECRSARIIFEPLPPEAEFIRGDPNGDNRVNIGDAIWIVNELFRSGPATQCPDAADINGDGMEDLADVSYLIAYQFLGGPAPPGPFPGCGADPTKDTLDCPRDTTLCP
jgi:hypothetical protein